MSHNTISRLPFVRMFKSCCLLVILFLSLCQAALAFDNYQLLSASKAFQPALTIQDKHIYVRFDIAPEYYLYRNKIKITTKPDGVLGNGRFIQAGTLKQDHFYGNQYVFYHQLDAIWPYVHADTQQPFELILTYQGCADAGVCYPPVEKVWTINPLTKEQLLHKPVVLTPKVSNFQQKQETLQARQAVSSTNSLFQLSRATIITNLLTFFIGGLGLSLTACMYPLLPIVSAIVVGSNHRHSKWRAFVLSFVYVQGLALTYTIVGIATARTGTFINAWLQQPLVVLSAAIILLLLAFAMLDLYHIQLPQRWQSFILRVSNRFHGGHLFSVFMMGALSALIVGPCVAPPLAFALGYIGRSGDSMLGGLALYVMALGTGVPLVLISVFGAHILPRAGAWMKTVKYLFGMILIAVATYIATPFLNYTFVIIIYTLLMLVPALYLYFCWRRSSGYPRMFNGVTSLIFLVSGLYFAVASALNRSTPIHHLLTLTPPQQQHFGQKFKDPELLRQAMQELFAANPDKPVLLDFYAEWCISCKEMNAFTLGSAKVRAVVDESRFLQIDVTDNTIEQQKLLHQYGLYGPPGLFVVQNNGYRSKPLLGYVSEADFLSWHEQQMQKK